METITKTYLHSGDGKNIENNSNRSELFEDSKQTKWREYLTVHSFELNWKDISFKTVVILISLLIFLCYSTMPFPRLMIKIRIGRNYFHQIGSFVTNNDHSMSRYSPDIISFC